MHIHTRRAVRSGERTRPRYSEVTDSYTGVLDFMTFMNF